MIHPDINASSLQMFQQSFCGRLITPGDADYQSACRLWNGMINKRPALIARCTNENDVIHAIQFAHSQKLQASVRSGGHNVAGSALCDDGLVIDLSHMKKITIDPVNRTARVQAGMTLGEFIAATREHGLATTTGVISDTGLAGLTLGGGIGWLMGKYGLTVDNLLAVDIITADGKALTANFTQNPDLFWGVRGGGGNFGVVTNFEFQLHPVQTVLAGAVFYPLSSIKDVLHFYEQYSHSSPDELTAYAIQHCTEDGQPVVGIALCHCGDLEEGKQLVEPVRRFGTPLVGRIRSMEYLDLIKSLDAATPPGRCYYQKAVSFKELHTELIDIITEYSNAHTTPFYQVTIQHIHGAACRVPVEETAFALREDHYVMLIVAAWETGAPDEHIAWARAFAKALEPYALQGVYLNDIGIEGEEPVQASFRNNYARLVALKNKYDPMNFFRLNQNIRPTVQ